VAGALTPSQTVGPFFAIGLLDVIGPEVVAPGTPGAIQIEGRLLDGAGDAVPDGMVEIWGADPDGVYPQPGEPAPGEFTGFGRSGTDLDGRFSFVTLKPGRVPGPEGQPQAPHLAVGVFARGLLKRLATRMYFPDEHGANAADPVLALLDEEARSTLIARGEDGVLRFDVRLQGEGETTFFAV
jgi:protocatechuate 3,4-dioxygenase, alpha subunit